MNTYFDSGYGFSLKSCNVNHHNLLNYIVNHKDTLKQIYPEETYLTKNIKILETLVNKTDENFELEKTKLTKKENEALDNLFGLNYINDIREYGTNHCLMELCTRIFSEETEIGFHYSEGQTSEINSYPAVMLSKCSPWEFTQKEQKLTQKETDKLLKKFAFETGLNPDVTCDDISVEYFG